MRSRVPGPLLAAFHAWYDTEHVPARIRIPGWLTARRYAASTDPESFLAYYDLHDLGVLSRPSYVTMRERRSESERRMLDLIPPLDRRVYRRLDAPGDGDGDASRPAALDICGALLLCVWWQPEPGTEPQFHDWYAREHLPALARIPGWLRSRRFELAEGEGPGFLAMHDLASADVFRHPGYIRATSAPRRTAVVARRVSHERVLYRLLRRFDSPRPASTRAT